MFNEMNLHFYYFPVGLFLSFLNLIFYSFGSRDEERLEYKQEQDDIFLLKHLWNSIDSFC